MLLNKSRFAHRPYNDISASKDLWRNEYRYDRVIAVEALKNRRHLTSASWHAGYQYSDLLELHKVRPIGCHILRESRIIASSIAFASLLMKSNFSSGKMGGCALRLLSTPIVR